MCPWKTIERLRSQTNKGAPMARPCRRGDSRPRRGTESAGWGVRGGESGQFSGISERGQAIGGNPRREPCIPRIALDQPAMLLRTNLGGALGHFEYRRDVLMRAAGEDAQQPDPKNRPCIPLTRSLRSALEVLPQKAGRVRLPTPPDPAVVDRILAHRREKEIGSLFEACAPPPMRWREGGDWNVLEAARSAQGARAALERAGQGHARRSALPCRLIRLRTRARLKACYFAPKTRP